MVTTALATALAVIVTPDVAFCATPLLVTGTVISLEPVITATPGQTSGSDWTWP